MECNIETIPYDPLHPDITYSTFKPNPSVSSTYWNPRTGQTPNVWKSQNSLAFDMEFDSPREVLEVSRSDSPEKKQRHTRVDSPLRKSREDVDPQVRKPREDVDPTAREGVNPLVRGPRIAHTPKKRPESTREEEHKPKKRPEIPRESPPPTKKQKEIPRDSPPPTKKQKEIPRDSPPPTKKMEIPRESPPPTTTKKEIPRESPPPTTTKKEIPRESPPPTTTKKKPEKNKTEKKTTEKKKCGFDADSVLEIPPMNRSTFLTALKHCDPETLLKIEAANPSLYCDRFWRVHCKKEFGTSVKNRLGLPWSGVYMHELGQKHKRMRKLSATIVARGGGGRERRMLEQSSS